ncbi:MAG: Holliday junction resolvase RuvX [Phycisphaerales bacterium]|nr:Holliday junction resolvase RuvX [Phycisphaerales bacterium]|tara:strand:- start:7669 stop:8073 length:405 start_codon:yes stop_codon:yes gene_type:complete
MLIMAIDLGDKRTGLAIGDEGTGTAMPVEVLEVPRGPALLEAISEAIRSHGPEQLVVGLPLNMDGTEGDRARLCRAFGDELLQCSGLPVSFQDERLSSDEANRRMARSGRTHVAKKRLRDALAACVVLEDFLDR